MQLKNISLTNDGLNIEFQNGAKDCFPYIWLRDHCKDIENWDERSNQRKLFTALVDPNIKIEETKIIEDNKKIEVKWPDMNKSVHYSGDFLYKNSLENISWEENPQRYSFNSKSNFLRRLGDSYKIVVFSFLLI